MRVDWNLVVFEGAQQQKRITSCKEIPLVLLLSPARDPATPTPLSLPPKPAVATDAG